MDNNTRMILLGFGIPVILILIFGVICYNNKGMRSKLKLDVNLFNPFSLLVFGVLYIGLLIITNLILKTACLENYTGALIPKESSLTIASVDFDTRSKFSDSEFILGKGSSDNVDYFYFYSQDDDGIYKLDKIDSSTVSVEKTDDIDPSVVTYTAYDELVESPTALGKLLGFKEETDEVINESFTEIVIYIPEDSVIKDFNP